MSKFICEVCENTLQLIVKTEEENIFKINTHGEIEFIDNRSVTQTLKLECDECGVEYEFKNEFLTVENKPILRVENIDTLKTRKVEKSDLELR